MGKVTHIAFVDTPVKPYTRMYRSDKNVKPVLWDRARLSNFDFIMRCLKQ